MAVSRPRVSVGLPVYNGEALLPAALDCLLGQTYEDFELVISDNASNDATQQICRSCAARDARVRYHRQRENIGASPNFNAVVELARGEYFKWAAYDDLCAPTFLEQCVDVLDRNPDVMWCHSRSTHINLQGEVIDDPDLRDVSYAQPKWDDQRERAGPSRESPRPHQRFQAVILGKGGCLDTYGLMRTGVIRATALYRSTYGWEKVFISELALRGRYLEIPENLFFARVHPRQASAMASSAEQQQYVDPRCRWRRLARARLLAGYLGAIFRANLCLSERALCLGTLARYLLQVNKWGTVLARALTGAGLGGCGAAALARQEEREQELTHSG